MIVLLIVLAYVLGSIPSAVWIGKLLHQKDVREYGSGNAGATNVFRVLGRKAGVLVLAADVAKGWGATQLVYLLDYRGMSDTDVLQFQLIFGSAALLGHIFPILADFRGGKGIATLLGFMLGVVPMETGICALIFLVSFVSFRIVSVSSMLAAISFPIVVIFIGEMRIAPMQFYAVMIPILVLVTHSKNMVRLVRGEEKRIRFKRVEA